MVAVIGPQTAATAEEHGLRVDVMAPVPSVTELVEALADFAVLRREEAASQPPAPPKRATSKKPAQATTRAAVAPKRVPAKAR